MRPEEDIAAERYEDRRLDEMASKGKAAEHFVEAIRAARRARAQAGLDCHFDGEGNAVFTPEQAYKAACHGREDSAASLLLQFRLMQRLDRNRNFMLAIIALLLYIAVKVHA